MNLFGTVDLLAQNPHDRLLTEAQIWWLTEWRDWRFVKQWQRATLAADKSTDRDSLEYASLAGKRWQFLREQYLTVAGWNDLGEQMQRDPAAEVGMALAVSRIFKTSLHKEQRS